MEDKEKRRFAWGVTIAALAFLCISCAGRMEATPVVSGREEATLARVNPGVYILTLNPGVCRGSVVAEARGIGAEILYSYVNFNMMAIRIPDAMTIEQVVTAVPSFRGGVMPDKILHLHNDER